MLKSCGDVVVVVLNVFVEDMKVFGFVVDLLCWYGIMGVLVVLVG